VRDAGATGSLPPVKGAMTGIHLQDAIADFEPSIARLEDLRTRRRSLRIQQLLRTATPCSL
jgi:hypothetical protein